MRMYVQYSSKQNKTCSLYTKHLHFVIHFKYTLVYILLKNIYIVTLKTMDFCVCM